MKPTLKFIDSACDLICKAIEDFISKENDNLATTLKRAGYLDTDYTLEQVEQLEEQLNTVFNGRVEALAEYLKKNSKKSLSTVISNIVAWYTATSIASEIQEIVEEQLNEVVPHFANTCIQAVDTELTVETITNRTSNWIKSWSEELAETMNINQGSTLEKILDKGLSNGSSVADVADELLESGVVQSAVSARRTALTEMLRAYSVSANEARMQNPAVVKKRWRHTGTYKIKPRANHQDMNYQIVNKEDRFELIAVDGHIYYPMYPHDTCLPAGEVINCHCIAQDIVDDDILGLSLEEREKLQNKAIKDDNKKFKKENEKGISGKNKNKSSVNTVNLKEINSKEFKSKFSKITDDENVNNTIYGQAKAFLIHRNGTDKEDFCLINSSTGKIVGKQTSSKTDFGVDYNKNLNKAIENSPEYSLIALHNHPTNNPPTGSDLVSAGAKKYMMGVVVTHNARVFTYKTGNKVFSSNVFDMTVDKYRGNGYNESTAICMTLDDFKKSHGIEWSEL